MDDVLKAQAAHVPRHYTLNVTLAPDAMLGLIQGLRALDLDENSDLGQLLAELEQTWFGDLPEPIGQPIDDGTAGTTA